MREPPIKYSFRKNGEKLYFLALTALALFMFYLGWQSMQMHRHPPPNPNPYIDEIYIGEK